jgi:hypothetical protein
LTGCWGTDGAVSTERAGELREPEQFLLDTAHQLELAERDGITEGLVCVFFEARARRTFFFKYGNYVNPAARKCLHLYYHFGGDSDQRPHGIQGSQAGQARRSQVTQWVEMRKRASRQAARNQHIALA